MSNAPLKDVKVYYAKGFGTEIFIDGNKISNVVNFLGSKNKR